MKITVAIPTYNRAALALETLETVLAQTRRPDEIIVLDDGSTDNTREAIAAYGESVYYIYKPNGGLSSARKAAYAAATGDTLLFLDSDDLLLPDALLRLEAALQAAPKAPLAFCRAQLIDAAGKIVAPLWEVNDQAEDMWLHLLKGNCIRSSGCVLMRREALEAVGGWGGGQGASDDWDLWLRLAETGAPFAFVEEPLFLYRLHDSNMSSDGVVMRRSGLAVLENQLKRHENAPERRLIVFKQYAVCLGIPIIIPGVGEGTSGQKEETGGIASATTLSRRHLLLRRLIERSGMATLYRKTPERYRRRFRAVFGIDPNL